jgi:hypothetical protein
MRYLLAIMCGLMVLFMGGCAAIAMGTGVFSGGTLLGAPLAAIPGGIAFLNVAVIGALFGWKVKWKPAFYILGTADILLAILSATTAGSMGPSDQLIFWIAAAAFAAKGLLSFIYATRINGQDP